MSCLAVSLFYPGCKGMLKVARGGVAGRDSYPGTIRKGEDRKERGDEKGEDLVTCWIHYFP